MEVAVILFVIAVIFVTQSIKVVPQQQSVDASGLANTTAP